MTASNGLRHVVVFAFIDERFPPRKNSKADVALLRAANLALRRKTEGHEEAFLLITTDLAGAPRQEDLDRYGIPGLSILTVCRNWHEEARFSLNAEETNEFLDLSHEEIEVHGEPYSSSVWESIVSELKVHTASALRNWLQANHPASLAHAGSEYADLGSYWVGIEATECSFPWPFELERFQNELPDNHRDKTVTWLNIMADAMGLHSNFRPASPALGDHQLKVLAVTLCEWLRGFEASNGGEPMNIFNPCAAVCSLDISPLLLGLAMSQHMPEHNRLEAFCEIYPEDHQQLERALRFATGEVRPHLRAALSLHFGGDDALFHALMNVADSMPNQSAGEFLAALREAKRFAFPSDWICPWVFVSEGWCEEADYAETDQTLRPAAKTWFPWTKELARSQRSALMVSYSGQHDTMTRSLLIDLLTQKLNALVNEDIKQARYALEMSEEHAPEMWQIAQMFSPHEWGCQIALSDGMMALIGQIDWGYERSAEEAPDQPDETGLQEILEAIS